MRAATTIAAAVLSVSAAPSLALTPPVSSFVPDAGTESSEQPARPSLIAETAALPAGEWAWIALTYQIEDPWHMYWPGQNVTGIPPRFGRLKSDDPADPSGRVELGEPVWPTPHRLISPGDILDHIYEHEATVLLPVRAPADAAGQRVTIALWLDWAVCDDVCLVGRGDVTLDIDVVAAGDPATLPIADHRSLFASTRRRVAEPAAEHGVTTEWRDGALEVRLPGAPALAFYPAMPGGEGDSIPVDGLIKTGAVAGDTLTLTPIGKGWGADRSRLRGIIDVTEGPRAGLSYWIDEPVPARDGDD